QDIVRSFVINEPGDYNIKVTVRDARGHETVIEQPLKIGQAAPQVILSACLSPKIGLLDAGQCIRGMEIDSPL
ncbi:hypothetical protein, partial [Proteus mirabilis]|uniref:hypothetical protein n=1 Tax=Proteus mirabilis TaxID=584 RepID=UPI00195260E7